MQHYISVLLENVLKVGTVTGTDPGFLEMGFICIKVCVGGVALLILSHFLKYPMKMKWSQWDQIISIS